MRISNLKLKNYKGFTELNLDIPDQNLLVLIGENGAGKSSILDALNKLLSELDYNLNGIKRQHIQIDEINIKSSFTECEIAINTMQNAEFRWNFYRSNEINTKPLVKYYPNKNSASSLLIKDEFIEYLRSSFRQTSSSDKKPTYLYFNSEYIPNAEGFIEWYKELVLFESYLKNNAKQVEYSLKEAIELAIKKFTGIEITATIADNFKTIKPVFQKQGIDLDFSNLSDGEKRVIGIVGKIVSYFVTSFKSSRKKLLEFTGIVLIDEIEQHLHPTWQQKIIPELVNTFPKVQFIITTHSPQVINNISRENIIMIENFKIKPEVPHTLGRDINSVLYDLFKLAKRPEKYQEKINQIYELLDHSQFTKAKKELAVLTKDLGENDVEIKRIQTQIELME